MFNNPRYEQSYSEQERRFPFLKDCRALVEEMINLRESYTNDEAKSLDALEKIKKLADEARERRAQVELYLAEKNPSPSQKQVIDRWLTCMPEELRVVWRRGMERLLTKIEANANSLITKMKKQKIRLQADEFQALEKETTELMGKYEEWVMHADFESEDLLRPSRGNVRENIRRFEGKWFDPLNTALSEMREANRSAVQHERSSVEATWSRRAAISGIIGTAIAAFTLGMAVMPFIMRIAEDSSSSSSGTTLLDQAAE